MKNRRAAILLALLLLFDTQLIIEDKFWHSKNHTNAKATLFDTHPKLWHPCCLVTVDCATVHNKMFMPAWGAVLVSSFVFLISFSNVGQ